MEKKKKKKKQQEKKMNKKWTLATEMTTLAAATAMATRVFARWQSTCAPGDRRGRACF